MLLSLMVCLKFLQVSGITQYIIPIHRGANTFGIGQICSIHVKLSQMLNSAFLLTGQSFVQISISEGLILLWNPIFLNLVRFQSTAAELPSDPREQIYTDDYLAIAGQGYPNHDLC